MGKGSSLFLNITLLLLCVFFKKLILCRAVRAGFLCSFSAVLYCHVRELIADLALAFIFCEEKSSLVVCYKGILMFWSC